MSPSVTGQLQDPFAVLRDYPVRLWQERQQYLDELLREFRLLLIGEDRDGEDRAVPQALVGFATTFNQAFGKELEVVDEPRRRAVEAGQDRIDLPVPRVPGIGAILHQAGQLLDAADEYCAQGRLLVLPRSEEQRRLFEWTREEIVRQGEGGPATPWPGPF